MRSRRDVLRSVLATATAGAAGCSADTPPSTPSPSTGTATTVTDGTAVPTTKSPRMTIADGSVRVEPVATGFSSPVDVAFPPDSDPLVADQPGVIYRVTRSGTDPFLDLRDRVVDIGGYSEQGLLGIALHPEFATNRRLFVRYSAPRRTGTPRGYSHTFVLAEFRASEDGTRGRPNSERILLELPQPQSNHNAGAIAFGPAGLLYVATGDGGGANDTGTGHVEDWYGPNDGGNGQDVTRNLLGSVLRIDVDRASEGRPYGIPPDNPLLDDDGRPEHYAWGFRNPWRLSFTGDELFVADVGQNRYEEVNLVERGGNYGWNVREATHCFRSADCPTATPDGRPLRPPIIEYPHAGQGPSGIAVIGGYMYTGSSIPALQGTYVFGDWRASGRLFVARRPDHGMWPAWAVTIANPEAMEYLLAFGRGPDEELYACTSDRGRIGGRSGALVRLEPA